MQSTCIHSRVSFNLSLVCTSVDIVIKALLLRFAGFGFAPNPIPPNVYLVPGYEESHARLCDLLFSPWGIPLKGVRFCNYLRVIEMNAFHSKKKIKKLVRPISGGILKEGGSTLQRCPLTSLLMHQNNHDPLPFRDPSLKHRSEWTIWRLRTNYKLKL